LTEIKATTARIISVGSVNPITQESIGKNKERRLKQMSLFDWHNRSMPKHYKYMYLDGFTPEQVFLSLHQRMKEEYFD
jgi:hypothetical protein